MLSLEWNALHPGDAVLVHDDTDRTFTLREGTVALVETRSDSNDIAIQLAGRDDRHSLVHPRQSAVHRSPFAATEPCWRCDASQTTGTHVQATDAESIKKQAR